jgi:hypothetical protein
MKVRTGFVSNSSSSSFILVNPKNIDEIDKEFSTIALSKREIKKIKEWLIKEVNNSIEFWKDDKVYKKQEEKKLKRIESLSENDDIYVTNFVSDSSDQYGKIFLKKESIEYMSGGHGIPYDENWLICLNPDEDDEYRRVYINK